MVASGRQVTGVQLVLALIMFCVTAQSPGTDGKNASAIPGLLPALPASGQSSFDQYCVLPKTYGDYSGCCGSQVYDYRYNVCCNGVLGPNYGPSTACCDQVPYNYNLYICCYPSMTIKYKTYGVYTSCCGSCCNSTVYDYRNQSCCNNEILYDLQTQICCGNGTVITVRGGTKNLSCCGSSVYNYETQMCCAGVIRPKLFGSYSACCGNQIYNYSALGCCYDYGNGELPQRGAVGMTLYNLTTQFCCNGAVFPQRYGVSSWCCGTAVYNSSASLCCNGTIVRRTYGDFSTCCGSTVINYQTTGCCSNSIGTILTPYNYKSEICCSDGIPKDKVFGDQSACCDSVVYNYTCNMCCGGILYCRPPNALVSCCGDKMYDYRTQLCCFGCTDGRKDDSNSD